MATASSEQRPGQTLSLGFRQQTGVKGQGPEGENEDTGPHQALGTMLLARNRDSRCTRIPRA